jgi:small-conductance mechanosensitive channel
MDEEILDTEGYCRNSRGNATREQPGRMDHSDPGSPGNLLVLQVAKRFALKRLARVVFRKKQNADQASLHLARQTKFAFMLMVSINIGSRLLTVPESVSELISLLTWIAFFIQIGIWAHALIDGILTGKRTDELADDAGGGTTLNIIGMIAKGAVWTIVLLLVLDNLPGIQVTTLIASLGIGGIAIGLALQNILGDLFASLSIALDKPFVIGDFIVIDNYRGTVEHIGLKSTRLRSISGEQLVFGNGDLLGSRIQNFKRMIRRRVVFKIGVTYKARQNNSWQFRKSCARSWKHRRIQPSTGRTSRNLVTSL